MFDPQNSSVAAAWIQSLVNLHMNILCNLKWIFFVKIRGLF